MINGDTIAAKIGQSKWLQAQIDAGKKPAEIIEDRFTWLAWRASRRPRKCKRSKSSWRPIRTCGERAVDDILWAVLNSREFLFNH